MYEEGDTITIVTMESPLDHVVSGRIGVDETQSGR